MGAALELFRSDELLARMSQRRIRTELTRGGLVRVRPGVFVRGADWNRATPEKRIVSRARALTVVSATRPVFSHETAAAAHGLPLYRAGGHRVHTIAPIERPGAAVGVIRHRGDLGEDVVEIDGMLCTNLVRTVADTARTMSFEQAVTIADAALRLELDLRNGEYDLERAAGFCRNALEVTKHSAHGLTRAQRVLDFADGRAQLPGESISRIRLRELGFRHVALQVRVPGPAARAGDRSRRPDRRRRSDRCHARPGPGSDRDERLENVSLVQADAVDFAFPAGVDAIVSTYALSQVPEAAKVVAHGAAALSRGGRWVVLDLKVPDTVPGWVAPLGTAIIRPFASIDAWLSRRPWESIRAAMQDELVDVSWTELLFGTAFLAAGTRAP